MFDYNRFIFSMFYCYHFIIALFCLSMIIICLLTAMILRIPSNTNNLPYYDLNCFYLILIIYTQLYGFKLLFLLNNNLMENYSHYIGILAHTTICKPIYLTHRWDPNRYYHSGFEWISESWQWTCTPHSLRVPISPLDEDSWHIQGTWN